MEFTPLQVSCSDQLMANARQRLNVVLPRMRTLIADNAHNIEPELAALARQHLIAIAGLIDPLARTEAVANLTTLHTLALYELAKATETELEPEPKLPNPAEIAAEVLKDMTQFIAANDSGTARLSELAELAVETMAEYIRTHHREVPL